MRVKLFSIEVTCSYSCVQKKFHVITPIANREWGYTFLTDGSGCFVFIVSKIQINAVPNPDSSLQLAAHSVTLLEETVDSFNALILEWISLV